MANRLLTTSEVSDILRVSPRTVLNWIEQEAIPYVALPQAGQRREYRIPLYGLLNSLSGTYDLASQLEALDEAGRSGLVSERDLDSAAEDLSTESAAEAAAVQGSLRAARIAPFYADWEHKPAGSQ